MKKWPPILEKPSPETIDGKGTDEDEGCSICFVNYEEATELRILPCTHTFHKKCIDP